MRRLWRRLQGAGLLIAAEALQPTETAATVRVRNGEVSITDGPFAETKEQLAGFYLIDARDLNEAIQVAAKIPPPRGKCRGAADQAIGAIETGRHPRPASREHQPIDGPDFPAGQADGKSAIPRGPSRFMTKLIDVFTNMDKMIGTEFDAGLANLDSIVET